MFIRRLGLSVALAVALVTPAIAVDNHYAKWRLGQPYGYRDLRIEPGRWKIRGLSYYAGNDFTAAMALHRVAIHAKAEGFSRFFSVSFKNTCMGMFSRPNPDGSPCGGTLDEEVDIIGVGYNDEALPPPCEEKGRWAGNCRSFIVDEVLERAGAYLKLKAEDQEREVAEIRAALPVSSR